MADYTVRNLMDVEDSAPKFGYSPELEARFAREDLGLSAIGLSYQRLAPGATQPFAHSHGRAEEVYVVVGGAGRMVLDDEVVDLRRWDAVRVAPATVRFFAAGPDGLEILAFGTAGLGDAEMSPAAWPQ